MHHACLVQLGHSPLLQVALYVNHVVQVRLKMRLIRALVSDVAVELLAKTQVQSNANHAHPVLLIQAVVAGFVHYAGPGHIRVMREASPANDVLRERSMLLLGLFRGHPVEAADLGHTADFLELPNVMYVTLEVFSLEEVRVHAIDVVRVSSQIEVAQEDAEVVRKTRSQISALVAHFVSLVHQEHLPWPIQGQGQQPAHSKSH